MSGIPQMSRPLPSFDQWLAENADGTRGDGFQALADVARLAQDLPLPLSPDERSFLRMWQGMTVAVVELCNNEVKHGRGGDDLILMMPRVLATAAMYSTASVLSDDAPYRTLAKVITEEFRAAAKECADQLARDAERSGP